MALSRAESELPSSPLLIALQRALSSHAYAINNGDEGKNPFSLDSKEPDWSKFQDFLLGEVRYLSVKKAYPNEAQELFDAAEQMAKLRYQSYVRKTKEDWSIETAE